MKDKTHKRQKFKKTTIILPYDLWESLRIESIKRNTSMGKANSEEVKRVRGAKAKRPPSCKWTKRDFSNLLSEYYPLNFKEQKPYSVAKISLGF